MTTPLQPGSQLPEDHVGHRDLVGSRAARRPPEEEAAGSEDTQAQAAAILAESEERTLAGEAGAVERRKSEETVAPVE